MANPEENEEKKKYLKGYIFCKRREIQLTQQISELRSQKMFPSVNNDGMPHGNLHGDLSGYVARLDDLISQLDHERDMAVRKYTEIYEQINKMQDVTQKEILVRRYLLQESWEGIEIKMNYSRATVFREHGKAIKNFELPKIETK